MLHVHVCAWQDYMHDACSEQVTCQLGLLQKSMIIMQFKWYTLQQGIQSQLFCTEKLSFQELSDELIELYC